MFNNAIDIDKIEQNNTDINLFYDSLFNDVSLTKEEESVFITIQTIDLSEAKKLFQDLTMPQKIMAMRYVFSRRIFQSNLLSANKKQIIRHSYEESYGSLCAMTGSGTETITLESQVITRILYIAETMSLQEYHLMKHELVHVSTDYYVIMQVIKNRLKFHGTKE